MSGDYISREAVLAHIKEAQCQKCSDIGLCGNCAVLTAVRLVEAVPAAAAVEVVRCRECIRKDICRTSNVWAVSPDDNWFCADGKRKEGGPDA